MDGGLKYFLAVSGNKRYDSALRTTEAGIDELRKRMLSRYWKDKFEIFDDMVRLNVRTPPFRHYEPGLSDTKCDAGPSGDQVDSNTISLGQMKLDSTLMDNKPVIIQKNKKKSRSEPVISIQGNEAICYSSKDSVRGRRVELPSRVIRRIEECKLVSGNLRAKQDPGTDKHRHSARTDHPSYTYYSHRSGSSVRPVTAPRQRVRSSLNTGGMRRGVKSAGPGVRPLATPISRPLFTPRSKSTTAILYSDDDSD